MSSAVIDKTDECKSRSRCHFKYEAIFEASNKRPLSLANCVTEASNCPCCGSSFFAMFTFLVQELFSFVGCVLLECKL